MRVSLARGRRAVGVFVAGLVWIARYTSWRAELHDERDRTLESRVERLEQLQRSLEDDLRERFRRPL